VLCELLCMCMAKVTLNKDGTPRKKGSGRKKGSISLIEIPLSELIAKLDADAVITVGRKWHEDNFKKVVDKPAAVEDTVSSAEQKIQDKIAFKLTKFN